MSQAIISSALRVSDYLDKQAIREKEKRKEKILSILPSFIEQQVSGISDKETLYKTIPKLSAELYTYGADVGNAANQILGNIAQTKFREIGEIEEKKSAQDVVGVISQSVAGKQIEYGGKTGSVGDILNNLNSTGMKATDIQKVLPGIIEQGMFQKKGIVEDTGSETFFREYDINKLGTQRVANSFKVNRKTGTMDNLLTKEVEQLPYAPEVTQWQNKLVEDERNAKQQLNKSITLAKFNQDYQFKKMEEMDLNKVRGLRYYDMDTKEQVKADKDKNDTPYFYTEKDEEIEMFGIGGKLQKVKTGNKVRVPYTKGFDRLQEIGQQPPDESITNADIDQASQNANRTLQMLGEKLIEKGEDRVNYVGPNGFFLRDKVLDKARDSDDPEVKKLLDAYTIKEKEAYDKTVGTTSSEIPSIFRKK